MEIFGGRRYVEIPGDRNHELPPLLVHSGPNTDLGTVMEMAGDIVESDELIPLASELCGAPELLERRRMDLAITLVEHYLAFIRHWNWGQGIVEWIRQCETTFDTRQDLRTLMRPDVWPHAGRSSFVQLLADKGVKPEGVDIEKAVGTRLTFRQPPPIECFSNQFLLLLNSSIADSAWQTWSHLVPDPVSSLPPERFSFHVYNM